MIVRESKTSTEMIMMDDGIICPEAKRGLQDKEIFEQAVTDLDEEKYRVKMVDLGKNKDDKGIWSFVTRFYVVEKELADMEYTTIKWLRDKFERIIAIPGFSRL